MRLSLVELALTSIFAPVHCSSFVHSSCSPKPTVPTYPHLIVVSSSHRRILISSHRRIEIQISEICSVISQETAHNPVYARVSGHQHYPQHNNERIIYANYSHIMWLLPVSWFLVQENHGLIVSLGTACTKTYIQ